MKAVLYHGGPLALLYVISRLAPKEASDRKIERFVLIDGDNLLEEHIEEEQIYKREDGTIKVPSIDYRKCDACGLCIGVCPIDAIVGLPNAKPTILIDRCVLCNKCLRACSRKAIVLKEKKAYVVIHALIKEKEFIIIRPIHYDNDPIIKSTILRQAIERILERYEVDVLIIPIVEQSLIEYVKNLTKDVQYVVLSPLSSIIVENVIYVSKNITQYKEILKALSNVKELLKRLAL